MTNEFLVTQPNIFEGIAYGSGFLGLILWFIKFHILTSNGYKLILYPDEPPAFRFYRKFISNIEDTNLKMFHTVVLYGTYVSFIIAVIALMLT